MPGCPTYFNPHTREGCDLGQIQLRLLYDISIHTPVKGVTPRPRSISTVHRYFNPHTREGCDAVLLLWVSSPSDFNPHTREGCDRRPRPRRRHRAEISIHTPVKGVTL